MVHLAEVELDEIRELASDALEVPVSEVVSGLKECEVTYSCSRFYDPAPTAGHVLIQSRPARSDAWIKVTLRLSNSSSRSKRHSAIGVHVEILSSHLQMQRIAAMDFSSEASLCAIS